jgi:hypothetical protein
VPVFWRSPLVTELARVTLSKWRQGFEPRWDYAGQRPYPEVVSASSPALAPRRARVSHGSGFRRRLPSALAQSHIFVGIYWQRYGWVAPDESV